jgi:hypothetical protein
VAELMRERNAWKWRIVILSGAAALLNGGCGDSGKLTEPQTVAMLDTVLTKRIAFQDWTQPVSFANNDVADGIEAVILATDAAGDPAKISGAIIFELFPKRAASGDEFGERLAVWPIELKTTDDARPYWDGLARFYKFPLQLPSGELNPGTYILTAQANPPIGDRMFAEYEFTFEGGKVLGVKKR